MNFMKKVPGGQVLIPLLTAILINTLFPGLLSIGGPTSALFKNGNQALMGLFLIVCGAQVSIKSVGLPLYKGSLLVILKLVFGGIVGWLVGSIFGVAGILGLTPFVLFCAIPSNNNSLYVALCGEYGDESDAGALSVLSIKNGPFGSMLIMGLSGQADIPVMGIIAVLIPLLIGILWGNLDKDFKNLCSKSQTLVVIFMSFSTGAVSSFKTILDAGASGILLGFVAIAVGIVIQVVYNFFLKKKTPLGVTMGTVAANAALTPAIIAATDPTFLPYVPLASAQCATASIVTLVIAPFLVAFYDRKIKKKDSRSLSVSHA